MTIVCTVLKRDMKDTASSQNKTILPIVTVVYMLRSGCWCKVHNTRQISIGGRLVIFKQLKNSDNANSFYILRLLELAVSQF